MSYETETKICRNKIVIVACSSGKVGLGYKNVFRDLHHFSACGYFDYYKAMRVVGEINLLLSFGEERWGAEFLLESSWTEDTTTILGWDTRYYDYDKLNDIKFFESMAL